MQVKSYYSAEALGNEIIRCLSEEVMSNIIAIAYIAPDDKGKIRIVTKPHFDWHLQHDRINCMICGNFYSRAGGGLRNHYMKEHKLLNKVNTEKKLLSLLLHYYLHKIYIYLQ